MVANMIMNSRPRPGKRIRAKPQAARALINVPTATVVKVTKTELKIYLGQRVFSEKSILTKLLLVNSVGINVFHDRG